MASVFLLWHGEYSSRDVVGVYSTLEAVESAVALMRPLVAEYMRDSFDIQETDVDVPLPDIRSGLHRWSVFLYDDGNVRAQSYDPLSPYDLDPRPTITRLRSSRAFGSDARYYWSVQCWARDEQHAAKIASDYKAQYVAEKEGIA
jgi:hypothetical protein